MGVPQLTAVAEAYRALSERGVPIIADGGVRLSGDVVKALADRIVVLHNGELVADGEPGEVIALPLVREIYLGIPEDGSDEGFAA